MNSEKRTVGQFIDEIGSTKYTAFVVTMLAIATMFDGFDYMLVPYTMSQIATDWGLDPIATGSLTSWSMIGLIVGGAVGGLLADKFGRKVMLVISVTLFSLFTIPVCFAPNFTVFAACRILAGLALGSMLPLSISCTSELVPSKRRAVYISTVCAMMTVGYVLASLVAMAIIPLWGWRPVFLVSGVGLLFAILLGIAMPESPNWLVNAGRNEKAAAVLNKFAKSSGKDIVVEPNMLTVAKKEVVVEKSTMKALFGSKEMVVTTLSLWVVYFCAMFCIYGINAWLPSLLLQKGFDLAGSYTFSMANNFAGIFGNIFVGWVVSQIGKKKGPLVGFACAAVAILIMAYITGGTVILLVAACLMGWCINMMPASINPVAPEMYQTSARSTGVAWMQSIGRLAGFLSPIIVGVVVAAGFDYSSTLAVFAIPAVIAMIFILVFFKDGESKI